MRLESQKRIEAFKRQLLKEYLDQCTPEQQAFFTRLYPTLPKSKLDRAIDQCERTVRKNELKRQRATADRDERRPGYGWTITADHVCDGSDVGRVGPRGCDMTAEEIRGDPKARQFRMHDDDGELYYEGFLVGDDADGTEPLDDFGTPNAGATEIRYRDDVGRFETL